MIYYILRYKRSDGLESITDEDHLAKQYSLVDSYGSLNILGRITQFPNGKVDTRDFGQNIHFGYKDKIRPGEKERALNKLQYRLLERLLEILEQRLKEELN
jgi:hypothetical protein